MAVTSLIEWRDDIDAENDVFDLGQEGSSSQKCLASFCASLRKIKAAFAKRWQS